MFTFEDLLDGLALRPAPVALGRDCVLVWMRPHQLPVTDEFANAGRLPEHRVRTWTKQEISGPRLALVSCG